MIKEEKTIDQVGFRMTPKIAIPIMGFLLVVSNLFTRQITVIEENRVDNIELKDKHITELEDLEEAGRRRVSNAIKELKLELEVERLERELKECKDK